MSRKIHGMPQSIENLLDDYHVVRSCYDLAISGS
jgi:hypothetical protein